MRLIPKNWEQFQHYRNRRPPWIKLHRLLLDDIDFLRLPVASRALAPLIWLLASESEDGSMSGDVDAIAFRLRLPLSEVADGLKSLIERGFLLSDSSVLAACYQSAIPEREREREIEREIETERETHLPADAGVSVNGSVRKKRLTAAELPDDFVAFLAAYGRGENKRAALSIWTRLSQSDRAAAMAGVPALVEARPDEQFRKTPDKWLRHRCWEDDVVSTGDRRKDSDDRFRQKFVPGMYGEGIQDI